MVIAGTEPRAFVREILSAHIDDDQFSYLSINGIDGQDVLPAIMISTIHPNRFREDRPRYRAKMEVRGVADDNLILVPLRGVCKDATDVVSLIEEIFRDIELAKPLQKFEIVEEIRPVRSRGFVDALIVKPTLWGVGIDIKELLRTWREHRTKRSESQLGNRFIEHKR